MRVRKLLCIVFACFMLVNCLGISAGAANVETQRDMKLVIERASGRFSLDVPASSDLLTSGDTDVTIYFSADNVSW